MDSEVTRICEKLGPHATGQELFDKDILAEIPFWTVYTGTVMYLMVPIVSGPMFMKMHKMQSCAGISVMYMIGRGVTNYWQFIAMMGESAPAVNACFAKGATFSLCYSNTIPLIQTIIQCVGTSFVVVTFTRLWLQGKDKFAETTTASQLMNTWPVTAPVAAPTTKDADMDECPCLSRETLKKLLLGQFAVTAAVFLFMLILILVAGVCASAIHDARKVISSVATFAAIAYPIPQIRYICKTKDTGALSFISIFFQVLGNVALSVNFATEGISVWAYMPYMGMVVVNFFLLFVFMWTKCTAQ